MSVSPPTPSFACPLQGASNFRDVGGYAAGTGHVRKGRVYRSDHLASLSAQDVQHLQALGIARSLDFRGAHERQRSPYQYDFLVSHALTVEPTILPDLMAMTRQGPPDADMARAVMNKTYTEFVTQHSATFAQVFDQLLASDAPVVMHCTAGKDRTGFAVALLHRSVGVQADDLMHDYLLTRQLFRRPDLPDNRGLSEEVLNILWGVEPQFLETAFQTIDSHYGSFDRYAQHALKLDKERRDALLERYTA